MQTVEVDVMTTVEIVLVIAVTVLPAEVEVIVTGQVVNVEITISVVTMSVVKVVSAGGGTSEVDVVG